MREGAHAILLIEPDPPTAELYQRELSREYQVFTCTNESAALDLLRERPISAVVLDPALNNVQGWELLSEIKAVDCSIPVILCSTLDERGRGIDLGAAAYLLKPALPTTLRDTLRRVIQQE